MIWTLKVIVDKLIFNSLRLLWKLPVFSIICNYPSKKHLFSSRYHLSCPITVDTTSFSAAKVSHLPCDTPPITHTHRMTFTEASYLLLSHMPRWRAIFCSAGASISFSLKLLSFFFPPSVCCCTSQFLSVCLPSTWPTFLCSLQLFHKILQRRCEMTLIAAAARVVRFHPGDGQRDKDALTVAWHGEDYADTGCVFLLLDKMLRKQLY